MLFQGSTARRTRVAVAAVAACALLCCAALATIGNVNQAISLVDEVDGLELNAYLTPNDVEEFQKVFTFLPFVYEKFRTCVLAIYIGWRCVCTPRCLDYVSDSC